MVSLAAARKFAMSYPETEEKAHFGRPSFRVKKKIFLVLWPVENRGVVKLTPVDQSVFCDYDNKIFYPATGAWGRQGYTIIDLKKVRAAMFKDALNLSWELVATKRKVR
jgi:predicted DNA-binding protein (MmcQ/YjbR family)